LAKAFAHEFATKLENNLFMNSPGSISKNPYIDLNLNQVIHPELIDTFFH
jgi:hypothetical protein